MKFGFTVVEKEWIKIDRNKTTHFQIGSQKTLTAVYYKFYTLVGFHKFAINPTVK